MTESTTDNFEFATVEAGDKLPQALTKENWEKIDGSLTAVSLTNVSGRTVVAGEVAVTEFGIASQSFTVTASHGLRGIIGIVQETIPDGSTGLVKLAGHVTAVKVDKTVVAGDWLQTSGLTTGEATPSRGAYPPAIGTFAMALTATSGSGSVEAVILPSPAVTNYDQWVDSNHNLVHSSSLSPFGPSEAVTIANDYDLGQGWAAVVDAGSITMTRLTGTGTPIWTLTTGSTSGNDVGVALYPAVGAASLFNPRMRLAARFGGAAPAASQQVLVGFCGSVGNFDDQNDIIAFRASGTGNIFAVCDTGGTETVVDLGITTSVLRTYEIEVTGATASPIVTFYVSRAVVATITTNIPTAVALYAQAGIRTKTTATKALLFSAAAVEIGLGFE